LQGGNTVGKLALADFQDTGALQKLGRTYFQVNGPISATVPNGTGVRQGSLEAANVVPSENAVRLVSVMRQFEMLQRAVTIAGDMNRKAIEEVARVS
jgi:flagellar basal-body rod protein FlgG